jgi:hypothetical protein
MSNIDFLAAHPFVAVLAILTAVLGVGRLSRVITYDVFPPAAWVRARWTDLTYSRGDWSKLLTCFWCLTPWIMLVAVAWFLLADGWVLVAWWVFWGWLGLSYASSMVIARDEPAE